MRLMQHKKEAYWFYRFLSIFYDDLVNPLFWTVPMREKALRLARLDGPDAGELRVIDVGAGTGFTTEGIVAHVPPTRVVSVDQSPHQIAKAEAKDSLRGVRFKLGDAEDVPARTNHYDRYISAGSIEYWPHPYQGVREAYRLTKPGGRATIIGPIQPTTGWGRLLANTWMLFPREAEYRKWYADAGFENVEVTYLDPGWWTGTDTHFALAIAGDKPTDGPNQAPEVPEPQDADTEGLGGGLYSAARVLAGSLAGGAFVPVALGAKALAALRGTDDPREPLTRAQRAVLAGVGVAAVGAIAALVAGGRARPGTAEIVDEQAGHWPESVDPRRGHHA